ncbi:MAG: BolA family protein [Pseudomonadota bacterium]
MRERLSSLSPEQLDLIDESALHLGHAGAQGGGKHYRLSIASPEFVGKSTIVCHRMIYDALGDLMHSRIHALSIQCVSSPG